MPDLSQPYWRKEATPEQFSALLLEQGHTEDEIAELLPLLQELGQWAAPEASDTGISHLLTKLAPLLPNTAAPEAVVVIPQLIPGKISRRGEGLHTLWQLLRAQIPLIRREIWFASAFVLALGWFVSVILYNASPGLSNGIIFTAISPLVAALGLSLLYGPENDVGLELALTTPTSPRQVLLARFVLVFGYDLTLTLLMSGAFSLVIPQVDLLLILNSWLGLMFFLGGLALLLSLVFGSDRAIQISLFVWVLRVLALTNREQWFQNWADLWSNTALLGILALILFGVSLNFVNKKEFSA